MEAIRLFLSAFNRPEPTRQATLLWLLATGVGRPDALMTTLESLADQSQGQWRVQLLQLHSMLKNGIKLSNALTSIPGIVPDATRAAIRVGQASGSLDSVLLDEAKRLSGRYETPQTMATRSLAGTLLSLFVVALFLNFVLAFMMIWIVPKLDALADAFAMTPPPVTIALIAFCEFLFQYWYLTLVPATGFLVAACVYTQVSQARYLMFGDTLFHRRFPRLRLPESLRSLSVAVTADMSLADAIEQFNSEFHAGRSTTKYMELRRAVVNGEDCWDAMKRLRLIRDSEHAFLRTAQATGHLDWGLMHLSRELASRRFRLHARASQILLPITHLITGLVVAFVAIAFFSWYVRLVEVATEF